MAKSSHALEFAPGQEIFVQPAVVRRAKRFLTLVGFGTACGLLAGATMVGAASQFVRFDRSPNPLVLLANVSAILLALVCLLQCYLWFKALYFWMGKSGFNFSYWRIVSTIGAGLSWVLLIAIEFAVLQLVDLQIYVGKTFWLGLVCGFSAIFGCIFSARFRIDPAGPPRVCPEVMWRNVNTKKSLRRYRILKHRADK